MRCVIPPDIIIWKWFPFCDEGITWTCVQGARRRCHPTGGGTDPVSASSDPGNGLTKQTQVRDSVLKGCHSEYHGSILKGTHQWSPCYGRGQRSHLVHRSPQTRQPRLWRQFNIHVRNNTGQCPLDTQQQCRHCISAIRILHKPSNMHFWLNLNNVAVIIPKCLLWFLLTTTGFLVTPSDNIDTIFRSILHFLLITFHLYYLRVPI